MREITTFLWHYEAVTAGIMNRRGRRDGQGDRTEMQQTGPSSLSHAGRMSNGSRHVARKVRGEAAGVWLGLSFPPFLLRPPPATRLTQYCSPRLPSPACTSTRTSACFIPHSLLISRNVFLSVPASPSDLQLWSIYFAFLNLFVVEPVRWVIQFAHRELHTCYSAEVLV